MNCLAVVRKSVGLAVVLQFALYQEGSELVVFSVVQFWIFYLWFSGPLITSLLGDEFLQ